MSSKKTRRRERQKQKQQGRSGRFNPATLFMVGIFVTIVLLVAGALVFGDRSAQDEPPWPGAVWSAEHNHWH